MICLGIESSAHTFGIGIVNDEGRILANEKSVYVPPLGSGIIPTDAANFHKQNTKKVLELALSKSKLKMENINIISYVAGAGLPPCLLVGTNFATKLFKKYKKPLIPVCHQLAHLEIGKLTTSSKDPVFLYLSGGNTQIIAFAGGKYRIFGETEDIPIGNALDTFARVIGIEPPYGPNFDKVAEKGKIYVDLPYVVKGMDLSFAGILTAAIKKFKQGLSKEDIAYSLQETCFAMLAEVTERALAHTEKREVLLVGGVAANKRLQEMIKTMCEERGANLYIVPDEFSGDQGVMIAWTGILAYKSKWKPDFKDKIISKWRTDEVDVTWL